MVFKMDVFCAIDTYELLARWDIIHSPRLQRYAFQQHDVSPILFALMRKQLGEDGNFQFVLLPNGKAGNEATMKLWETYLEEAADPTTQAFMTPVRMAEAVGLLGQRTSLHVPEL